jgi:hypothetical protein
LKKVHPLHPRLAVLGVPKQGCSRGTNEKIKIPDFCRSGSKN